MPALVHVGTLFSIEGSREQLTRISLFHPDTQPLHASVGRMWHGWILLGFV